MFDTENFKDALVWIDIETTGLDPKTDKLLQVALILTDNDFNEIAIFDWIIQQNSKRAFKKADSQVQEMHRKTGLWDRLEDGQGDKVVEWELREVLQAVRGNSKWPVRIGGNSVHFDLGFLKEKFPTASKELSHQVLDMSAVLGYFRIVGQKVELPKAERTHDALDDIRDTINQAKLTKLKIESLAIV